MTEEPATPTRFRHLMSRWATGVSVVTALEGDRDHGMTVNALLSVSLSPPLLLVSLSADADTTGAVERSGRFAVSLLASDQQPVSERFARPDPPEVKFLGLSVARGRLGPALVGGALGWMECRVRSATAAADHRLILGEVEAVDFGPDATPLLFHRSGYAQALGADTLRLPPPRTT
jgi:3-hydroxy-9,10-secoandrosta-1,3,5(10)-triene-9,17-dione monooxygenase reductase component